MFVVKSKNQLGEEILINPDKIAYAVPSSGGQETVIFFDNDTHISVLESFDEFRKRFENKPTVKALVADPVDEYPSHLPRLPTGNVDKRTNQYKEWIASKEAA
jgi:hypothetical protein